MSLPLAVAVIVLADLALLGLLAFAMSRVRHLRPHVSTAVPATDSALHRDTRAHGAGRPRHRDHVPAEDPRVLRARA
jgi:hypothetical protein